LLELLEELGHLGGELGSKRTAASVITRLLAPPMVVRFAVIVSKKYATVLSGLLV
jgi:hypothetical protein